jgi:hypothetical protein
MNATTPIVTGIDSALYLGLNELTISPNWIGANEMGSIWF